ncbi:rhodanese-like domain-containing protein, partial [Methylopila musalis]
MSFGTVDPGAYLAKSARDPRAALIDVRSPAEFAGAHATGARNAPLDGLDAAALQAHGVAPGDPV